MSGIIAKKIGMSRVISPETGEMIPVTLLEIQDNEVLQVKTTENDGYEAFVLGAFKKGEKYKNINKNFGLIREFSCNGMDKKKGDIVSLSDFAEVPAVKVTGISKGRGFAGVIKRHNFSRGPETHGSHHHREPGSVGMCAKPARILKGKKLPGRFGTDQVTIRSTEVVRIDENLKVMAVKGGVPGAKNSYVILSA